MYRHNLLPLHEAHLKYALSEGSRAADSYDDSLLSCL